MSHERRPMSAGLSDSRIKFLDGPDYDEAYGPPDKPKFLEKVRADIRATLRKSNRARKK